MQAAVVQAPGQLVVQDIPEPLLGEYGARCRILYGTLCAGTDTHLVQGHEPFSRWVQIPFVLGHESVGRVTETGARVRHLRVGDLVTRVGTPPVGEYRSGWGGFAEWGVATDWQAMRDDGIPGWNRKTAQRVLPPDVSPQVGPLFITWRETASYIRRLGVNAGASVLIIGSGGNALAFASHARNLNASDVVMVGAPGRQSLAAQSGATEYFDYRSSHETLHLTDRFDFVVDVVGKRSSISLAHRAVTHSGTIGIYGLDEPCRHNAQPVEKPFTLYTGRYDEGETHDEVLAALRAGALDPHVWLNHHEPYPLARIGEALRAVANRSIVKPLIVMVPSGSADLQHRSHA